MSDLPVAEEQPKLPVKDKPTSLLGGQEVLDRPLKGQKNHGLLFWRMSEIAAALTQTEDAEKRAELLAEKDQLVDEVDFRLRQVLATYF